MSDLCTDMVFIHCPSHLSFFILEESPDSLNNNELMDDTDQELNSCRTTR